MQKGTSGVNKSRLVPDVDLPRALADTGYRKRWAVIIGIDHYPNLPEKYQLDYAEVDAGNVMDILRRDFGFEMPQAGPLFGQDATKEAIQGLLDSLRRNTQQDDAVLAFYAGHGTLYEGKGYLVPTEGRRKSPASWVSVDEVVDACTDMPTRHVLLIIDACFAGNFLRDRFKDTGSTDSSGKTLQVLLAGTATEEVPDMSLFAQVLREGLSGLADLNKDDVISADELIDYVVGQVEKHSTDQQPLGGYLIRDVDTGGQLEFRWHVPHLPSPILQDLHDPRHRCLGLSKLAEESPRYEGALRDLAIEQFVCMGLDDVDKENVRVALRALGVLREHTVVDRLIPLLSDITLAAEAAWALGQIGDEGAIGALVDLLGNNDYDEEARAAAATALGAIGHPDAAEPLQNAMGHWERLFSKDEFVVGGRSEHIGAAAARALGYLYSPEVVRTLLGAYKSDGSVEVKSAVADALKQLGSQATPSLVEYLNRQDVHVSVRVLVAKTLGAIRATNATDDLIEALQTEGHGLVEGAAARALGEIGDRRATSALIHLLTARGTMSEAASEALGKLNDPQAIPALMAALSHDWLGTRVQAARSLGKLKDRRALAPLKKVLGNFEADFALRQAAAEALGDLGACEAVPVLKEALIRGAVWHVREKAAYSIARLESADGAPTLISVLDQADLYGVLAAIQALAELGDDRAVGPLRSLAEGGENDRVRQAARDALAEITRAPTQ